VFLQDAQFPTKAGKNDGGSWMNKKNAAPVVLICIQTRALQT
jgi:hypothetical protein